MASRKKPPPSIRLVESAAAELRLVEARAFIHDRITRGPLWLVGPSRGSVDDLARSVARECGATIGLHRFSVTQLAARLAAASLADARLAPATYLGSEAVAARAVFETAACGIARLFRSGSGNARLPACTRPHPAGAAHGARGGRRSRRPSARRWRFVGTPASLRAAVRAGVRHRSRDALRRGDRGRSIRRRRQSYRWCCWMSGSNPRSTSNSSMR